MKKPPLLADGSSRLGARGFSLLELLAVVALGMIMATLALPAVAQMRAKDVGASAERLGGILENARAYAMSKNTYVWVGLLPVGAGEVANTEKLENLVIMVMSARSGREADLAAGNLQPIGKPTQLSRIKMQAPDDSVLSNEGRETLGNEDISSASLSASFRYRLPMAANQEREFTRIIQFSPTGEARIKAGASRTIEIGLHPAIGDGSNFAILQVNGLTGAVRTFRP